MKYIPIKDITINQSLDQVFYITDVFARKTKQRKPFTILSIRDAGGIGEIKIWGFDADSNPELKGQSWARVICDVKEYQGQPDLTTSIAPTIVPQPADITPYVSEKRLTDDEIETHWSYLTSVMESVRNPYLKEYLNVMFSNDEQRDKFKYGAASATNRGSFRGGLPEHISKVMRNALHYLDIQLQSKYRPEKIDRDLIIAGVMAHDIGKAYTYEVGDIETVMTRCGYLIDHLPLSYSISVLTWVAVESIIRREVPEHLKDALNHIILSHHGEDYSPVKPQTIEAVIVAYADATDGRVSQYAEAMLDNMSKKDNNGFVPGTFCTSKRIFVGDE
jgi:3'-5' exoribonuclease